MNVLIIEDNDTMREGMVQIFKKLKLDVEQTSDGAGGVALASQKRYDLIVTDYRMAGMTGLEVLNQVKKISPQTQVMIITAYGSIDLAVQAIQQGAADFITKPFSHEEFRLKVEKILSAIAREEKLHRLSEENLYLRQELEGQFNFGEIIGDSAKMQQVYRTIAKVAPTDSTVIIYGESGTGKELVARAIHKASDRCNNPFIRVNCGALAETLLESELFGHEKGAFTGAIRLKRGRFELADSGTIFLDEIGDLPLATQVKLLRVLQEREFERVGGEKVINTNVRVIAATHHDLSVQVAQGKFREDLYFRLHIIPIYLPPLRERIEDIPILASHFLKHIGEQINRGPFQITQSALHALQSYSWPGNVRELENILERCAVLAEKPVIAAEDLPIFQTDHRIDVSRPEGSDLNSILESVEKRAIENALRRAKGIKTEAARLLGLKTSALYYKLEKYGLLDEKAPEELV